PAFLKFGPSIELQPLSVFNLRLAAEYIGFFGTFGYLQSFQTPTAVYSDTALDDGKANSRNYSTNGIHAMIEPTIQLKVDVGKTGEGRPKYGSIAIRNKLAFEYWWMNLHASDPAG